MSEYKPLKPGKQVPRTSLLHPECVYTPAAETDLRARVERMRAEHAQKPTPFRRKSA